LRNLGSDQKYRPDSSRRLDIPDIFALTPSKRSSIECLKRINYLSEWAFKAVIF